MNGGTLHFEMRDKPNASRGLELEDKPFSLSKSE
jgi:putative alpha-1,2-mannosidase